MKLTTEYTDHTEKENSVCSVYSVVNPLWP